MRRALLPFALAAACVLAFMLMGQAPSPTGAMELYSHGGGAGGLDVGTADARYLKLDASNDPITGNLEIDATGDTPRLTIEGKGPGAGAWACGAASVTPALAFSNSTHGMGISQGQGSGVDELVLCNQGARISIGENSAEFAFGNGIKPDGDDARVFGTWVDGSPGTGRRWLLNASRLLALKSGTAAAPSIVGADANANTGIYFPATDELGVSINGSQATRWSGTQTLVPDGSNVAPSFAFASSPMTGLALASANTLAAYASGVTLWDGAAGVINVTAQLRLNTTGGAAAPDLSFSTDTDSGFRRVAANTVALTVGGTDQLTLDSTNLTAGVAWLGPSGSAGAPGISFSGDSDTGFYRPSAGQVSLAINGSAVFDWTSTTATAQTSVALPSSTSTAYILTLPRQIGTTTTALPTCTTSANGGKMIYVDDTNSGKPAEICVCTGNGSGGASWVDLYDRTSCTF